LIRELDRKLPVDCPKRASLDIFRKVLNQTTKSKNKIHSLHEPEVYCIAKGKAHKNMNMAVKRQLYSHKKQELFLVQ
jgi:IS5 family transposase